MCYLIEKPHFCQMKCHDGDCSPCKKETSIKCRCGNNSKIIPCADLGGSVSDFSCKKRCTKVRNINGSGEFFFTALGCKMMFKLETIS